MINNELDIPFITSISIPIRHDLPLHQSSTLLWNCIGYYLDGLTVITIHGDPLVTLTMIESYRPTIQFRNQTLAKLTAVEYCDFSAVIKQTF